jgi:hypothetical protein
MNRFFARYFRLWWLPSTIYIILLACFSVASLTTWRPLLRLADYLFWIAGVALIGVVVVAFGHFIHKRWSSGFAQLLLVLGCGVVTVFAFGAVAFSAIFGPSEDGFADDLKIPEGIEIAVPEPDISEASDADSSSGTDALQLSVRKALAVPGGDDPKFVPAIPSLRKAATDYPDAFKDYIEASPDWHVFLEQGNRFAKRRWSYGGVPRDTLHGYISDFDGDKGFQTRCLLCLDQKQWSRYSVQKAMEGNASVVPELTNGNNLNESRVMIDCGGVWVEVFEQSSARERRVTKATLSVLETEFSEFVADPKASVARARARNRDLAKRLAGEGSHPLRLLNGMQPGIYGVTYALNPGEPGMVYLKAFEVTQETPLSVNRLEESSKTRMSWSADSTERFGAKAGFTIYEGDWGKPYAARFEAWFKPDSGGAERKLAERVFKIEGWMR